MRRVLFLFPLLLLCGCIFKRAAFSPKYTFIAPEQREMLYRGASDIHTIRKQLKEQLSYASDQDARDLLYSALQQGEGELKLQQSSFFDFYNISTPPLAAPLRLNPRSTEVARESAQKLFTGLSDNYAQARRAFSSGRATHELNTMVSHALDAHYLVVYEVAETENTKFRITIESTPDKASFYLAYIGQPFNEKNPAGKTNRDVWLDYVPWRIKVQKTGYAEAELEFDPFVPRSSDVVSFVLKLIPPPSKPQKKH